MATSSALCPILVGREQPLSDLEDALLSALRAGGGIAAVGGEAGMGKSRLIEELAGRASRLGCRVLRGGCSETELPLPYLPFLEAIGNHLGAVDLEALQLRLGPAGEELGQLFPQFSGAVARSEEPAQARSRLFEAVLAVLRDAAGSSGLLLVLEDLHWADPATRELLEYLHRRLRSDRVLVVGTYRSDELHRRHPLQALLSGWRRAGGTLFVDLAPLGAEEVGRAVAAILHLDEAISIEFRDFLQARTEGNPFVLEEMLKDAIDRGDIFPVESGWDRRRVTELRLPETVRDSILMRIERMKPAEVELLSAAAVIGRSFELETVAAISGRDDEAAASAVRSGVVQQLLEVDVDRPGRYRFRHALTREAIYEDMLPPLRRRLHGRAADILSHQPGHRAGEVAQHLLEANRAEEALPALVLAAEEAARALAHGDAAKLLEKAAAISQDQLERGRILCRIGEAYWSRTEPEKARKNLEEGIGELESRGAEVEAAGWRLLLGRCQWELQRPGLARDSYERARQLLESRGPSEALAIAYIRLSGLDTFEARAEDALGSARRAAEVAQACGSGLALAWSWNFMALAEVALGRVDEGFAHLERSLAEATDLGLWFQTWNAIYNATWVAVHLGDGSRAGWWTDRSASAPGSTGSWGPYLAGLVRLYQGDVGEAERMARLSLHHAEETGFAKMLWRSAVLLAQVCAEADRGAEAEALMPPLEQRAEAQDAVYDGTGRVRAALGRGGPEAAITAARTVPPAACDLGSPADAVAEVAQADPGFVRQFLEGLQVEGEAQGSPRLLAARGNLALAESRLAEARAQLGEAVSRFREGGFQLDAWHAERALALAEFRAGAAQAAEERFITVVREATSAGALLASRLARESAAACRIELASEVVSPARETPVSADHHRDSDPGLPANHIGEKLVTVLFIDVRGYTALTGRVAPAELASMISSYQRWASEEVARHRGVIDKFAGDAVMAVFNVGGDSVDHTEQALLTAIAVRDKAALMGLPVGAGLAVGPAVVGRMATGANLSVLGEVTNLAARLQAASGPGEITLSAEAHRRLSAHLSRQALVAEPVSLDLKGFDGPQPAYRLEHP